MLNNTLFIKPLITALLLMGLTFNVAAASTMKMGGIIPGAGLINRNMLSMRELKFTNIVLGRYGWNDLEIRVGFIRVCSH